MVDFDESSNESRLRNESRICVELFSCEVVRSNLGYLCIPVHRFIRTALERQKGAIYTKMRDKRASIPGSMGTLKSLPPLPGSPGCMETLKPLPPLPEFPGCTETLRSLPPLPEFPGCKETLKSPPHLPESPGCMETLKRPPLLPESSQVSEKSMSESGDGHPEYIVDVLEGLRNQAYLLREIELT